MWPIKHGIGFSTHPRARFAHRNFNQVAQATIPCGACNTSFRGFRQDVRPARIAAPGPGGAWEHLATDEERRRSTYDLHECVNDKLDAQHFAGQMSEIAGDLEAAAADGLLPADASAAAPWVRAIAPLVRGRRLPYAKLAKRQEHTNGIDVDSTWVMMCIMALNYHPERAVHRAGYAAMVPVMAEVFDLLGGGSEEAARSVRVLAAASGGIPEARLTSANALFVWVCALRAKAMHPTMDNACAAAWIVGERCRLRSAKAGVCSAVSCK